MIQSETAKGDILVVDDMPANLELLEMMLSQRGYNVRPVISGQMALTTAKAVPPDLILLDITMPELNGYQVCELLKADERTRDIPVIFISASDEVLNKVKGFGVGGVDYITKPFQFEEVLVRIENHLALRNLQKQLQHANGELVEANSFLTASNAELDAFAHTVAHDLKNPLGVMIGYSEYLLDTFADQITGEVQELFEIVYQHSQKMRNIIDELLLLARVRKGEVKAEPLDMSRITQQAQQRLSFMIRDYQGEVVVTDNWPIAEGYAPWVEEVWTNYISNALKYGGEPPHLKLGATPVADNMIRFWVRDNGPGLSKESQAQLFTRFTRLDETRAKGHGLGLSIVRRIIEKLGGNVGVESKVGAGSIFYFTLPAAKE